MPENQQTKEVSYKTAVEFAEAVGLGSGLYKKQFCILMGAANGQEELIVEAIQNARLILCNIGQAKWEKVQNQSGYFYKIAIRQCIKIVKRTKKERSYIQNKVNQEETELDSMQLAFEVLDFWENVKESLLGQDLTEFQANTWILRVAKNMSFQQIGKELNTTKGSAQNAWHKAKMKITLKKESFIESLRDAKIIELSLYDNYKERYNRETIFKNLVDHK